MKLRMTAIVLALGAFSWAQTATSPKTDPAQPSAPAIQAEVKTDCPCCQKMADGKATESCCAHHQEGAAKSDAACCKGKDGKGEMSCMKTDKDKSAESCSKGKCAGDAKKDCCAKADKTEHASMACCGANGEQCGAAHHDHADMNK